MNDIVFRGDNGMPVTTSLKVAEVFGKVHKNVLRDIETLGCSEVFQELNFELSFKIRELPNGGNKKEPYYNITRDGFTILAMGYTGKKAMEFKEQYIAAFNAMEQALSEGLQQSINALTRKQLAEMVLSCENEKEELMQRLMDTEAELDGLKNDLAARVLRLEQKQRRHPSHAPQLSLFPSGTGQPVEYCDGDCVQNYRHLRTHYPRHITVERASILFRLRGLDVSKQCIFRYLCQEGYVSTEDEYYHRPLRHCVQKGWMVCTAAGESKRHPGRRYYVPHLSPAFVDMLERMLKERREGVQS